MPASPCGAVVADVDDEVRNLDTIRVRNSPYINDPLHPNFISSLFDRIGQSPIFSLCDDWAEPAEALREIIVGALQSYFGEPDGPYRSVYNWAIGAIEDRWDYAALTRRGAKQLMLRANSISQYANRATTRERGLLRLARDWLPAGACFSDQQILAVLAIKEAMDGTLQLRSSIEWVAADDEVSFCLRELNNPKYQIRALQVEIRRDLEQAINRAIRGLRADWIACVTNCRIDAEKLLLLAELRASGGIDGEQAERMTLKIADAEVRRQAAESARSEQRKRQLAGFLKGAEKLRKLSDEDKASIMAAAAAMRKKSGVQEKQIEIELAKTWDVSRSTIQRTLGKK